MLSLVQNLWHDEDGVILSAELVLILTIAVLGLVVGLVNLQNAVLGEMNDIAGAFRSLNQSYSTPSFRGCWKYCCLTSFTAGSCYIDQYQACVTDADLCPNGPTGYYGTELNNGYACPGTGSPCHEVVPPSPSAAPTTDRVIMPKAETLPTNPPADATK